MQHKAYKTIVVGVAFSPNIKANVFEALRMSVFLIQFWYWSMLAKKQTQKLMR